MSKDNLKLELEALKSLPTEKKSEEHSFQEKAELLWERFHLKLAVREQAISDLQAALKQGARETRSLKKSLEELLARNETQKNDLKEVRATARARTAQLQQMTESRDAWKAKAQAPPKSKVPFWKSGSPNIINIP